MIGTLVTADCYGVDEKVLQDAIVLMDTFRLCIISGNAEILNESHHAFTGGGCGVTGFFLLSESHASFHTYPEFNYIAIDVFTCGRIEADKILNSFVLSLNGTDATVKRESRGINVAAQSKPKEQILYS